MYIKSIPIILFIFVLVSCSKNTESKPNSLLSDQIISESTPDNYVQVETTDNSVTELKGIDKYVIYTNLLTNIFYNSNENVFGHFNASDALAYRLETISPFGIEQIETNSNISKSLISSLVQINGNSELLDQEYDIKAPIISDKGNRDLKRFYEEIKRKYPDTKAVINFSKIGFNYTSQGLVYAEYFRSEKGVVKLYILIKLSERKDRILPGTIDANILEISKIFQVN